MIGESVTLVRVKAQGFDALETFTTRGVIVGMTEDAEGAVSCIHVQGVRLEDGAPRNAWFAVGPRALDGSLCAMQTATLDACGCPVTDQCGCDLRRAAN